MNRCAAVLAGAWLAAGAAASQTAPAEISAATLTDRHVRLAIAAIVDELIERKDAERFWEPESTPTGESAQAGGYTALVVLALMHGGVSYQLPALRDAVRYLEGLEMDGTYAVAVRAAVWAMLPPKFHDELGEDAAWLQRGFSPTAGGWTYRQVPNTTRRDNSITQYGALALWEAAKRGVRVERRIWQQLEQRFLEMQLADGGWNYAGDGPATGSMTTAGLATLAITQDLLHAKSFASLDRRPTAADEALELGLDWMDTHFSATENPGRDEYFFYYLYGVERVGLASGRRHFGAHDWFREGAAEIIARLCDYEPQTGAMRVHERIGGARHGALVRAGDLAFGLLFLSRGRVPVAINKLSTGGAWNNRPRDVANLTAWLAEATETALAWQIVSADGDPRQWLDAPMLYLASHQPVAFTEAQRARLQTYLDRGGLLLAVAEGGAAGFTRSVEQTLSGLYPDFRWRPLPDDHWPYTLHWPVSGRPPALRAISNGVRELAVLVPGDDLARVFQTNDAERDEDWKTAAHLYLYASEMNRARPRLGAPPASAGGLAATGATFRVRHAYHDGNWNPEPAALAAFGEWLAAKGDERVDLGEVALREIHVAVEPPALVIVNGIEPLEFSPAERDAVRGYVERGGVILFETPGGRGGFTASAERAMVQTFAGTSVRAIRRSRTVTGEGLPGADNLARLEYRPYALEAFGARETAPRLRGLVVDGEPRVLFSREDISHALLDRTCWGVAGYGSDSARSLLRNILLHAHALGAEDAATP